MSESPVPDTLPHTTGPHTTGPDTTGPDTTGPDTTGPDNALPGTTGVSRIVIYLARTLGTIDRKVFGGFVEHLGRCIYGGLYEAGSPLSDERGFRADVLALLRELRLGVLRWPGGNFVSNYHWTDGIGPRPAAQSRARLGRRGAQHVRHLRVPRRTARRSAQNRSVAPFICLNMGMVSLRGAGLGRVLQLGAEYALGRAAPGQRPRRGCQWNIRCCQTTYPGLGGSSLFPMIACTAAAMISTVAYPGLSMSRWL